MRGQWRRSRWSRWSYWRSLFSLGLGCAATQSFSTAVVVTTTILMLLMTLPTDHAQHAAALSPARRTDLLSSQQKGRTSAAPAVAFPSRLMSERMGISEASSSMSSWLYGSSRVVSSVIEPVVVLHLSSIIGT
ncbi:hypothetical protein PVAP13_7NG194000 [Panicum virgatum]|uniref:Uncharacterized protein n=1 Tax=Panicum virgatum TaxID=38727 RepID=A0A8T0PXL0_PANVG|nr:hypothetical protein PVAP13_7NG194000 [Panicum virgatum]